MTVPDTSANLVVQPLVGWPRTVSPGESHIVTVDLRPAGEWMHESEEFTFSCMLDGAPYFTVESLNDPSIIVHRFGGSYGPAKFAVTAEPLPGDHFISLNLATRNGDLAYATPLPITISPGGASALEKSRIETVPPRESSSLERDATAGHIGANVAVLVSGRTAQDVGATLEVLKMRFDLSPPYDSLFYSLPPGVLFSVLLFSVENFTFAHIGDHRGYLLRGGKLLPIAPEESFDTGTTHPARQGDRYLLCTAALWESVSVREMFQTLSRIHNERAAANELMLIARDRGADESTACVVCDVDRLRVSRWRRDVLTLYGAVATASTLAMVDESRFPDVSAGEPDDTGHDVPSVPGYEILGLFRAGGLGRVWRARDATGHELAIKHLRPGLVRDYRLASLATMVIDASARIRSRNVLRYQAFEVVRGQVFIVSPLIVGPVLTERIDARGPVHGRSLWQMALELAEAIAAIHDAGLAHQRVKPSNILLDNGEVVLIGLDWCIIRQNIFLEPSAAQVSTPAWAAPEVLRTGPVGKPSDVYGWGCTLAYAATGRPPFGASEFIAVPRILQGNADLDGLPDWLAPIVRHALAVLPADRPTAEALVQRLRAVRPE